MTILLTVAMTLLGNLSERELPVSPWSVPFGFGGVSCSFSSSLGSAEFPTNYYGIDLVPTKRVPGTGSGMGSARVTFADSPYGVAVSQAGVYVVNVALTLKRVKTPAGGVLVAWATKDDLSETVRLGPLSESLQAAGQVRWNKFLLVVTLEPMAEASSVWKGPIVMRGMSRSGLMHTLAGHGPYEQEPCAKYGF